MIRRNSVALILITLGATFLIAAALLHLSDYPKDLSAVGASNLRAGLKGAVRALRLPARPESPRPSASSNHAIVLTNELQGRWDGRDPGYLRIGVCSIRQARLRPLGLDPD